MKPLRTLLAALTFAATFFVGHAGATLVGETIDGDASYAGSPGSVGFFYLDQPSATIGVGAEFTAFGGDFVTFDFAADTLTIIFGTGNQDWLGWPSYTFSGFDGPIASFDLASSDGLRSDSHLLGLNGFSHTDHSITLNFGEGWLLDSNYGNGAPNARVVFSMQVPEPQTYTLVLVALGLMGVSLRRRSALPR